MKPRKSTNGDMDFEATLALLTSKEKPFYHARAVELVSSESRYMEFCQDVWSVLAMSRMHDPECGANEMEKSVIRILVRTGMARGRYLDQNKKR